MTAGRSRWPSTPDRLVSAIVAMTIAANLVALTVTILAAGMVPSVPLVLLPPLVPMLAA